MAETSILIVEDERIVSKEIELTLKSMGYKIAGTTINGEDAIALAKETKPDLVLMDVKLKGKMDGIEAAKEIYAKFGIPIIFLTAYSNDSFIQRAKKSKAFGYLVKPFDEKSLNSTIQMALQKKLEMSIDSQEDSKLDLYDRKIINEILKNSRLSVSEVGRRVRLSKGVVNYRIKRLIENGYVNKFYSLINYYMLGYQYYRIFIKFGRTTPEIEKKIIEQVKNEQNCLRLCVTEGAFNLILFSIYKNPADLRKFIGKMAHEFDGYFLGKDINNITCMHVFNQRLLPEEKNFSRNSVVSIFNAGPNKILDDTDVKIMRQLNTDARIGLLEIAEKTDVEWKTVKYRIKKFETAGLIAGYTTELNPTRLGEEAVQLNISIKDSSVVPSIIEFFNNTEYCISAYELLGSNDLMVELNIRGEEGLKGILDEFQKKFCNNYTQYDVSHISNSILLNQFPSV